MESLFDLEELDSLNSKIDNEDNGSNIILKSNVVQDEYTNYIHEAYDLSIGDTSKVLIPNNLNIDSLGDWQIGVICGASGSGKSTILKELCKSGRARLALPKFDNDKCLISNFANMTPKEASFLLSAMGLASVPTWIRPYNVLSNGEKYRADLAKMISEANDNEIILVDEYTSVVDRNVAKSMSNALQKYIRKGNKKIILATCHFDIFEWLRPDWIYDLNKGGVLTRGDYLRRPSIELQVYRTTTHTWQRFKKYHYMTSELNEASNCLCFTWDNKLVAFVAVLPMPVGTIKGAFRGHRTVVLPDFQGLGLGSKITDFVGGIYKSLGKKYYTKTVNPALGKHRNASKNWEGTGYNGKYREKVTQKNMKDGLNRASYCHKYVGEPIYGYEELVVKLDKLNQMQLDKVQMKLELDFD